MKLDTRILFLVEELQQTLKWNQSFCSLKTKSYTNKTFQLPKNGEKKNIEFAKLTYIMVFYFVK